MPKNETFSKDVIVRVQEKGWMTSELMQDRIKVVWQQQPATSLGGHKDTKYMLVLDAFCGHLTPEVEKELDSSEYDLIGVPGGITSVLQTLDASVKETFKENLR